METKIIQICEQQEKTKCDSSDRIKASQGLHEAAALLKQGEVVAFPTETVYGLGANALNPVACSRIFEIKGRPADNPLIAHVASVEDAKKIASQWTEQAEVCAKTFWPGPLTMVLPKQEIVPYIVSGGLDTVAIRMPSHPVALELIQLAGFPLAAPSANISGKPSPTEASHVWHDLKGKIPMLIDAGKCEVGLESTVLDLSGKKPTILRPGGITREQLIAVLGEVGNGDEGKEEPEALSPRSPGMKYKHYAPDGEVVLLTGSIQNKRAEIISRIQQKESNNQNLKIALLCMSQTNELLGDDSGKLDCVFILGSKENPQEAASRLFEGLRVCDAQKIDVILAEEMTEEGIGVAFMNRLKKAAGKKESVIKNGN